jgi:hypothetical protein
MPLMRWIDRDYILSAGRTALIVGAVAAGSGVERFWWLWLGVAACLPLITPFLPPVTERR